MDKKLQPALFSTKAIHNNSERVYWITRLGVKKTDTGEIADARWDFLDYSVIGLLG